MIKFKTKVFHTRICMWVLVYIFIKFFCCRDVIVIVIFFVFLESWVDISAVSTQGGGTPGSITPQLTAEYLRLLKEAQESNQSSARVSLAGSRRDSPRCSPKSPPNSPVQGTPLNLDWQPYYINSETKEVIKHNLTTYYNLHCYKYNFNRCFVVVFLYIVVCNN